MLAVLGGVGHVISKYIPTKRPYGFKRILRTGSRRRGCADSGNGEAGTRRGIISGEEGYLPLDVVNTYLNQRYYWDAENQQILYATPSEVTSMPASSEAGSQVWLREGAVYLSLSYIRQYTDLDAYIYDNPNRIAVEYHFQDVVIIVTAKKDTYVRFRGGIKSEVPKVEKRSCSDSYGRAGRLEIR